MSQDTSMARRVHVLGPPKTRSVEYMEMKMTIRKLYRSLRSRRGQALVEYSVVLALVAVFALAALRGVGKGVNATLSAINSNLP